MHSIRLNIHDSVFDKVIYFLNNLPKNEVEIVEEITSIKEANTFDYEPWSEKEIQSIGKIGFISASFEDDNEDYSKW